MEPMETYGRLTGRRRRRLDCSSDSEYHDVSSYSAADHRRRMTTTSKIAAAAASTCLLLASSSPWSILSTGSTSGPCLVTAYVPSASIRYRAYARGNAVRSFVPSAAYNMLRMDGETDSSSEARTIQQQDEVSASNVRHLLPDELASATSHHVFHEANGEEVEGVNSIDHTGEADSSSEASDIEAERTSVDDQILSPTPSSSNNEIEKEDEASDGKEHMKQQLADLLDTKRQQEREQINANEDTYLKALLGVGAPSTAGLSKYHQRLMTSTIDRQRFVTGRYPLYVTVRENPTRKWLGQVGSKKASATSEVLINGTSIDRSLASYDRFQWLDDDDGDSGHDIFSLELLAEIHVRKPGYVNVLTGDGAGSSGAASRELKDLYKGWNRWRFHADNPFHERWWQDERESDRLWITGFSLTKQAGELTYVDVDTGHIGKVNKRTARAIRWPNEVNSVPVQYGEAGHRAQQEDSALSIDVIREQDDALLVSDGFLVPGRDRGGLYIVRNPGNKDSEWRICLTGGEGSRVDPEEDGWFYHRSIWADLTGDGRQSILTARAKIPSILSASSGTAREGALGQLVWLESPKPHSYDKSTGTALDVDGTVFDPFSVRNTPWKVRVLDEGPDVMFSVCDLDTADDTIEVIASQFFSRKLSLHSIQIGDEPKVSFSRTLDERCGASFSSILANLDGRETPETQTVVDSGSTVTTLKPGDVFSHLVITSHECTFAEDTTSSAEHASSNGQGDNAHTVVGDGIRYNTDSSTSSSQSAIDGGSLFAYRVPSGKDAWKTDPWVRSVIATGFRVRGQLGNMINPGAPGFCYTFYPTKDRPGGGNNSKRWTRPLIGIAGDCAEAAYILRPASTAKGIDHSTNYSLMCEIETGSTVGSIGIGYDDFVSAEQQSGYAKIYVPCYEQNKILVFAMGDKYDEDEDDDDGW